MRIFDKGWIYIVLVLTLLLAAGCATSTGPSGPWLTGLEAVQVASEVASGRLVEVSAHVSPAKGVSGTGDGDASSSPSPGAGFAMVWWINYQDGEQRTFCEVSSGTADCGEPFPHPDMDGDLSGISIDSPAVFQEWDGTGLWRDMLARDDFSILLDLRPDFTDPAQSVWAAYFTVHKSNEAPTSASFEWNLDTGATSKSSF
jgi:hypothetical protein